jgi:hypothetical protein
LIFRFFEPGARSFLLLLLAAASGKIAGAPSVLRLVLMIVPIADLRAGGSAAQQ